jgi:tRNA(Arg) A34 adenosine deaminase TadA
MVLGASYTMHETHMRCCLALGRAALDAGEIPVGAIVVRGEEILGEGSEEVRSRLDPSAHAEVQAIRAACQRLRSVDLSGCTLYSIVEPGSARSSMAFRRDRPAD